MRMRISRQTLWRDRSGATIVEFALTAPLLLTMMFGIIESGRMMWTYQALQHGAQIAARCAAVDTTLCGDSTQIASRASAAAWGISPDTSLVAVTEQPCGRRVAIDYPYVFLGQTGSSWSMTLHASSCFPHS